MDPVKIKSTDNTGENNRWHSLVTEKSKGIQGHFQQRKKSNKGFRTNFEAQNDRSHRLSCKTDSHPMITGKTQAGVIKQSSRRIDTAGKADGIASKQHQLKVTSRDRRIRWTKGNNKLIHAAVAASGTDSWEIIANGCFDGEMSHSGTGNIGES